MAQPNTEEKLTQLCESVLAPLVEADGGELFLVSVAPHTLAVHLAGTCSGCPGATLTTRGVIEPAVRSVAPGVKVTVTTGARIPEGARRLTNATPIAPPGAI